MTPAPNHDAPVRKQVQLERSNTQWIYLILLGTKYSLLRYFNEKVIDHIYETLLNINGSKIILALLTLFVSNIPGMTECIFERECWRRAASSYWQWGSGVKPFTIFTRTLSDFTKAPFLSIKVHFILDWIGYLLYDIIQQQKSGECCSLPPLPLAPRLWRACTRTLFCKNT